MNHTENKKSRLLIIGVIIGDICWMNALFTLLYGIWPMLNLGGIYTGGYGEMLAFNTICYILCMYHNGVTLHKRKIRNRHIVSRVLKNNLLFAIASVAFIALAGYEHISTRFFVVFHCLNFFVIVFWRFFCRYLVRRFRSMGNNVLYSVFLGSNEAIYEICKEMDDAASGYRMWGYFDEEPKEKLSQLIPYLGKPEEILAYLEHHEPHHVYCCLPPTQKELIRKVIYWTENHFKYFFHVPHLRTYLRRRMWYDTVGDVPVLSLHVTPLSCVDARFVKRAFDLLVSGAFLFTVFPFIYLIVGGIIKITSPGPIFFKQKRNGINGKEFWCYKFRSMKVNKDADKVQATKNDPRKTKFGDFMRKTNIDELPQLINVFLGDMSLVGPRPHMLKHTEEYSQLIATYMVRHYVKPGITGWAQVTGFRGETKELHQMEGRVKADIWYMEHWSFILDLNIIYKTFANVLKGEKEAY